MSKLNLPPFYIGQKVVYITGKIMPKNSIHTVTALTKQPCGCWSLSIETKPPNERYVWADGCGDCGKDYKPQPVYVAWNPDGFRPFEEKPLPLLTFEQIKKEEKEEILILN